MKKSGRPTEYSEEILKRAEAYIEMCDEIHEIKERPVIKEGKVEEENFVKTRIVLPTVERLALELDVHRDTLYEWASKYPIFSDTLAKLKAKQADMLIQYGLSEEYNPTIAKLMLSANHDMREKTDATTDGKPINVVFDEAFKK